MLDDVNVSCHVCLISCVSHVVCFDVGMCHVVYFHIMCRVSCVVSRISYLLFLF